MSAVVGVVLGACGGSASSVTRPAPSTVTGPAPTAQTTTPASTSTLPETTSITEANAAVQVVLRLPVDWADAVVWAVTDDYPEAELRWEATGSVLEVMIPGAGSYVFWAETPSSDDGLCFYQAQSHPQWEHSLVDNGDTVRLEKSGEVCE